MFLLNSRITFVRFSSELIVNCIKTAETYLANSSFASLSACCHTNKQAWISLQSLYTRSSEPILIPKLRIRLADFPYLHWSNMPEAVHLGDLLRIWVRPGARFTPSPPDFHGPARAHRTPPEPRRFPRRGPLSRGEPVPGRPALHKEKRTLPGAPAGFSGIACVTALGASRRPSPPLRIRGSEPDSLSIG